MNLEQFVSALHPVTVNLVDVVDHVKIFLKEQESQNAANVAPTLTDLPFLLNLSEGLELFEYNPNNIDLLEWLTRRFPGQVWTVTVVPDEQTFSEVIEGSVFFDDEISSEELMEDKLEDETEVDAHLYTIQRGVRRTGHIVGYLVTTYSDMILDEQIEEVYIYESEVENIRGL